MTRHIVARTSDIPPGGNKVVGVDGRKVTCRARLTHNGALLAEAEGLCIIIRET